MARAKEAEEGGLMNDGLQQPADASHRIVGEQVVQNT